MKKFYMFFTGIVICFSLQSQVSQVTDPLMSGGQIRAYAKNSSCVLVASDGGIFKTTNQGQSWTNASKSFNTYSLSCRNIVSIGDDFYATPNNSITSSIYKSTDNGDNWTEQILNSFWPQAIGKLSNTLYAAGEEYNTGIGWLYSSPDGSTWTKKAQIWENWQGGNCELLSFTLDRLFIHLNENLYYTSDGNGLSTVSVNGLGNANYSESDNGIAGDASGNLFYISNNLLYKYNFTNDTWIDNSTGKIPVEYQLMELSVTENTIFITAMSSTLGIKLYRSNDHGDTFTELSSTGLAIPMVGNIIEVSANGFIGNALDDQVILSADGGNSWSKNVDEYIAVNAGNLVHSGNSLLFSKQVTGLIISNNKGVNWNIANNGIPGFGGIAYFVNDILQVKDTLFSFVQSDPFSDLTELYKSSDNGASWTPSPIPAPYNTGENYAFAGKCDSALFVSYFDQSSSNFALIVSFKNGNSWVKPNSLNTNEQLFLKGPKNCLFAFSAPYNEWDDFTNVSRANNFGISFTDLNTNLLFNDDFLIKRIESNRGDKGEAMMDFDVAKNKAIFAVRDRISGSWIERLYLYNITSTTWSEVNTTGLPVNFRVNYIKYVKNDIWLLATNYGIYKSVNGGVEWTVAHNTDNWQNGMTVNSIEILGDKKFLGTLANGVWVLDLATGIIEPVNDNDLQIFPNPTAGIVNILMPDYNGKAGIVELYSYNGKLIVNKTINMDQFQLDLKKLPSGSYFVIIKVNSQIYRKTIIRE